MLHALRSPERSASALQPGDDPLQRNLQRRGERGRGERVVNVVEARQRECYLRLARGSVQLEARRADAFKPYVA